MGNTNHDRNTRHAEGVESPPAWLNLEAIHPPEELAKLPALVEAARGVLAAVATFNREHLATMHAYYARNDKGPGDLEEVDELTGMAEADGHLLLAGHIIARTVVGQGTVTASHAAELMARHGELVHGVRGLYGDLGGSPVAALEEAEG